MSETDRFQTLEKLTAEAAETLKLPADSEAVRTLAALRLAHSLVVERMVNGAAGADVANSLLSLNEAIARIAPAQHVPNLEIKFCSSVVGIYRCKFCGKQNELPEGEYVAPAKKTHAPRTIDIDAEVISEPAAPARARAALPAPVEAKAEPPTRRHPGSIHDQPGVPLKRYDEPWRGYGGHPSRRQRCPLSGVKRHRPDLAKCLLLTQSGH